MGKRAMRAETIYRGFFKVGEDLAAYIDGIRSGIRDIAHIAEKTDMEQYIAPLRIIKMP